MYRDLEIPDSQKVSPEEIEECENLFMRNEYIEAVRLKLTN